MEKDHPKNTVRITGCRRKTAHKSILETLEEIDAAAKNRTEEIPKLHTVEAKDALWTLRKHRYEGWENVHRMKESREGNSHK